MFDGVHQSYVSLAWNSMLFFFFRFVFLHFTCYKRLQKSRIEIPVVFLCANVLMVLQFYSK